MKTGIVGGAIGVVIGLVIGVFVGPSIRSGEKGTGVAAVAKSAEPVDELFCGEAKDGELVNIKHYGEFRLNAKQKELAHKGTVVHSYRVAFGKASKDKIAKENPWILEEDTWEITENFHKLLDSLEESRKKAAANK